MSGWPVSNWRSSALRLGMAAVLGIAAVMCVAPARRAVLARPDEKPATVTCATCHAGVVSSYSHVPMRHAMEPANADPVLQAHPDLQVRQNGYSYRIQTKDGKSTYSVTDGTATMTLPIHWVFGQKAQTFVLEKDGRMYEGLVSYFPSEQGLATTPGDEMLKPANLTEAMGRQIPLWEGLSCFNCHATNAVTGTKFTLDKLTPGLDCERCHEGAQQHMADAANDNFKTLPKPLRRMTAGETSNFCGRCHRTWETVVRNRWKGPAFVRFAPYRLQISKCFAADDARISCLACHNPHQPVTHDQAFYDKKCLACHGEAKAAVKTASAVASASAALPMAKSCPVAKANCSTCHMPKVELPGGHAQFTDHFIRVVHQGEPYPD